ncbi:hypothetical protein JCM10021v2_001707 [Rhodotorula toruloides]
MVASVFVGSKADEWESDHDSSFGTSLFIALTASSNVFPHDRTFTLTIHPKLHVKVTTASSAERRRLPPKCDRGSKPYVSARSGQGNVVVGSVGTDPPQPFLPPPPSAFSLVVAVTSANRLIARAFVVLAIFVVAIAFFVIAVFVIVAVAGSKSAQVAVST